MTDGNRAKAGAGALSPIALQIWDMKYRLKDGAGKPVDATVQATWKRVAKALAAAEEPARRPACEREFFQALAGFRFLPAGRILAGAGTSRNVTLFNCFVMGTDRRRHGRHLRPSARGGAHHAGPGGGIGYDLLHAAPEGRAGGGRRRRRLGPADLHGRVGRDVPHDHERGQPARRHDGDHALRPPGHRGLRRGQAGGRPAAHVQPVGAGHGRVHGRGEGRRGLGAGLRRHGPPHGGGARTVGPHHARHLGRRPSPGSSSSTGSTVSTTSPGARRSVRPTPAASSRCRPTAPACWARSTWRG